MYRERERERKRERESEREREISKIECCCCNHWTEIFLLLLQSGGITPSQLAAALASATQGGSTSQVSQRKLRTLHNPVHLMITFYLINL